MYGGLDNGLNKTHQLSTEFSQLNFSENVCSGKDDGTYYSGNGKNTAYHSKDVRTKTNSKVIS